MKRFLFTIVASFFVLSATSAYSAKLPPAPEMTPEEFKSAKQIYFNYCGGCHGMLRKGATGPKLTPEKMVDPKEMGQEKIERILDEGTKGGMRAFGKEGLLTEDEVELVASFLQNEVPDPPPWNMKDIKKTWKVIVPVKDRPAKPAHSRNWQNYFGVVLRDIGKAAFFDGDTKEKINEIQIGFATHILRTSASGRYFFSIGRDGKVTMIDNFSKVPTLVAEVRPCLEARSVDTSKYKGFEDKYAIVGCYWPPGFVTMDGGTLEPIQNVATRGYTYDKGAFLVEARVAAIVASHYTPEWVLNIKETGYVWLVNYSNIESLSITMIPGERFLHDGGWDATHRYFQAAANMRDTMVIIDTKERKRVAKIKVGIKPHPGRGANWTDPKYGPVTGTVHIGEPKVSIWGSDPKGHPEHAWKVVRTLDLEKMDIGIKGGGQLFLKTHPKSKHVWLDFPLNTDKTTGQCQVVLNIDDIEAKPTKIQVADHGRVVHQEYNKAGDEVWISVWDKKGEIVIYDDKTLKEKQRITGLHTPTGKFNVYNTMHDIY